MNEEYRKSVRAPTWSGNRQRDGALALWRGIDLRSEERKMMNNTAVARDVVAKVLGNLGLEQKRSNLEILKVWNHLLDPDVVAHAQPTGLRNGTLFVTVDSSVWLDEIVRYRGREILKRLQHSFGRDLIARISYRTG